MTFSYAVTARHCIEEIEKYSCDGKAYLRYNTRSGGMEYVETLLKEWKFHSNDRIDVACINIRLGPNVAHRVLPTTMALTKRRIEEYHVGLGDEIFFVGLFREHSGQLRNVPIVRVGNIAAMPEEPVRTRRYGSMDAYLIEARSIGGLSGSPVFVHVDPQARTEPGTTLIYTGKGRPSNFFLVGLIHGHWEHEDSSVAEDGGLNSINMGIAVVVPFQVINEVLNCEEYASFRATWLENRNRARRPPGHEQP